MGIQCVCYFGKEPTERDPVPKGAWAVLGVETRCQRPTLFQGREWNTVGSAKIQGPQSVVDQRLEKEHVSQSCVRLKENTTLDKLGAVLLQSQVRDQSKSNAW